MKVTLTRTPDQIEMVKAMASKNKDEAYAAQSSLAEFMAPLLSRVIQQAPTVSNLFERYEYMGDDNPSLPLDLFNDITDKEYLTVWQQTNAGGLATNEVYAATQELKFKTIDLATAWSFDKKHAERSRLDVVGKTFQRMGQEILIDQENLSAKLIMGALAAAQTNGFNHVRRANISGRFLPDDLNTTDTLLKRIWTSWYGGGTPVGERHSISDMLISPEITQELRRMSYNSINTKGSPAGGTPTDGTMAPDAFRNQVWNSAGIPTLWDIKFIEINELGINQRFNAFFSQAAGATNFTSSNGLATGVFDSSQDQILIGIDRSNPYIYQAVNIDAETDTDLVIGVDDQFPARANKIGWYGKYQEGRAILDNRALVGLICRGII